MDTKSIQAIFSEVPRTYELVNHVLTMGLDIVWRKRLAELAGQSGGRYWLDIASGTGEAAILLRKLAQLGTTVVSQDFSMPMLRMAAAKPAASGICFCVSDALKPPFKDNTFDLLTISFATRTINSGKDALIKYFREFYRILKPGGKFLNLETSQPQNIVMRKLFHLYVRGAVMPLGSFISGSRRAYKYLSSTIPVFFGAGELADILRAAGFRSVSFKYLTNGVSAIHTAIK